MGNLSSFCCWFKDPDRERIKQYIVDNNILKVEDGVKVPYLKNFEISNEDYVKHCNFFININQNTTSRYSNKDELKYKSMFNDF